MLNFKKIKYILSIWILSILSVWTTFASSCNFTCPNDGSLVTISSSCELDQNMDCRWNDIKIDNNVIVKVLPWKVLAVDLKNHKIDIWVWAKIEMDKEGRIDNVPLPPKVMDFNTSNLSFAWFVDSGTDVKVEFSTDGWVTFPKVYTLTDTEKTNKEINDALNKVWITPNVEETASFNTGNKRYDTGLVTIKDFWSRKTITSWTVNVSWRDSDNDTYWVKTYCDGTEIAWTTHTVNLAWKTCQKIQVRMYDTERNDRVKVYWSLTATIGNLDASQVYVRFKTTTSNGTSLYSEKRQLWYRDPSLSVTVRYDFRNDSINTTNYSFVRNRGNSYTSTYMYSRTTDGNIRGYMKNFDVEPTWSVKSFEWLLDGWYIMSPDCRSNSSYIGWYNPTNNAEMRVRINNNGSYSWDYRGHDRSLGWAWNFYKLNSFSRGYKQLVIYLRDGNWTAYRYTYSATEIPNGQIRLYGRFDFENKKIYLTAYNMSNSVIFDKSFDVDLPTNGLRLDNFWKMYPRAGVSISCTRGGVPYSRQYIKTDKSYLQITY